MKIRKVDDKPMVIHTKEKAKIHAHEPKGAKIKGSNIYTVERGPKTAGAKVTNTDRKKSYRKSTIHQSESKNKGLSRFKRNYRESNTSIKTKNTNLHIAGRTGALAAGAVTEHVEGGQEVSQAAYLAYEASRPVTGTASKGAALFRKKAAAEAKKRIKKVDAGKKLAKKTAKKAAKDTAKTVAKETAKETAKTTAKVAAKTASKTAATAAGTAVAPGVGTAIGIAAGYAAGVSIEVKDEKMTNRSRKIKFFLDKMKAQENQTDSMAKLVKDLIVRKAITWVKAAAPIVGLVLLLLVLVVAMIAVPVIAAIAILYNSPFALFLPPLESGDTVQTVTSAYVQEFNRDVNTKVNEHTGYDLGELVYCSCYTPFRAFLMDVVQSDFAFMPNKLDLANKTIMVVPKPLIGQTASEFLRLYPSANILVATERDFEKSRRKQFVSRIATGDYDCIIMSHSQFEKIPISAERKERMLNEQIDEISYAIDEMKERNGERWTVKQMESQKKKLEEQLKSLSDESRKDDLITFEELGVDSIMVDEAHNFKNLAIFSKMNNVSGISSSGAKKSTDMQLKCQYLSEINDGRGIVFATGTPISNTMCEMYVMQLYLQKAALEEMGIYHFDSWAANFGEVTTALELTVEGSGFRFKSRFNKFTNLPELMNIFREVADVQTADMLDLDVPALRGGKPIIVESEPDWYVKQVMEDFVVRAERIRGGGVDPSVDNFLKITHEARLLGTDARLIDKDAPNNPDGKLNKVAENVWKEYEKGNANGHIGCQLIFSDIGTPGPDKDFTIYDYLKETLIQYGIPAEEIAFIHDAKTDAQRDALFKEMRTGKKKVLIGSTDKCGTGVNVQTHLVASLDLE